MSSANAVSSRPASGTIRSQTVSSTAAMPIKRDHDSHAKPFRSDKDRGEAPATLPDSDTHTLRLIYGSLSLAPPSAVTSG